MCHTYKKRGRARKSFSTIQYVYTYNSILYEYIYIRIGTYVQLSLSIQFYLFGLKACALSHLRNESLLIAQQNQKANANKTILTNERVCAHNIRVFRREKSTDRSNILENSYDIRAHTHSYSYIHLHSQTHSSTHVHLHPTFIYITHPYTVTIVPFSTDVKHSKLKFNSD